MKSNLLGRSMGNSNRGRAHHHLATDICLRQEARLAQIWLARGRAIKTQYPDGAQRRRIYKTSLSPRSATTVLDLAEAVRAMLQDGAGYARWTSEQRFTFIRDVLALLSQVPSFRIATTLGRRQNFQDWPRLLRWWLAKATLPAQPAPREITSWYDFSYDSSPQPRSSRSRSSSRDVERRGCALAPDPDRSHGHRQRSRKD
jgi:hypothetical protein